MKQKQILFIYPHFSTFIKKDYDSLNKKASVLKYLFKPEKQLFKFAAQLLGINFFLIKHIRKTDIIYCWFSDYHSFFPMLFGQLFNVKTVIVAGGFDAVSIPELKYGIFYKKGVRRFFATQSFKRAKLILPVHKSLIEGVNYYADKAGIKTGIKAYVKHIKADFFELPTGYDSSKWYFSETETKENSVITVAGISNMRTYKLKNIDLFIKVAERLKDVTFIIIGVSKEIFEFINKDKPENLLVYQYVENDKLRGFLAKSKVYCQFSLSEGLPNALCEAMLCECIPVGSDVNGIPDGIGDAGFILKERNVNSATNLVKKALESDMSLGKKARQHIIDNYSHNKREQSLYKLLDL